MPDLAGTAAAELHDLRVAVQAAIESIAATGAQLVLLGDGPTSQIHSPLARGTLHGFGLDTDFHLGSPGCGGALDLPPSLTVGAWLVSDALGPRSGAMGCSVGPDFEASPAAGELLGLAQDRELALLVLGDSTARLDAKAPGYLDERAAGFDDVVAAALAAGDGDALDGLDADLGADLLAAGVPAWRAAGALLAGTPFDARVDFRGAPYGVGYFVATWLRRA